MKNFYLVLTALLTEKGRFLEFLHQKRIEKFLTSCQRKVWTPGNSIALQIIFWIRSDWEISGRKNLPTAIILQSVITICFFGQKIFWTYLLYNHGISDRLINISSNFNWQVLDYHQEKFFKFSTVKKRGEIKKVTNTFYPRM